MRGTFANIRIKNEMLDGVEGGYTLGPDGQRDLDLRRGDGVSGAEGTPLVIFGGRAVWRGILARLGGQGHGPAGRQGGDRGIVRAHPPVEPGRHGRHPVRVHRRRHRASLGLKGDETVSITGLEGKITPLSDMPCTITYGDGTTREIMIKCRIDTEVEIEYIENGGVLHYVLRNLAKAA